LCIVVRFLAHALPPGVGLRLVDDQLQDPGAIERHTNAGYLSKRVDVARI
jgi:hypothetical protein